MVDRLKRDLIETGSIGRTPPKKIERYDQLDSENGLMRPTGTAANKEMSDYAAERMKEIGLEVKIDKVGNMFGRKEGSKTNKGVVMCGSHLDSVLNGGMLDGALGVFAGIEAVRRMKDEGFENERPIEIVVFTGEEGSAFSPTLLGSSVLVGKMTVEEAWNRKNAAGQTLREALDSIGYVGDFVRKLDDVEYSVEMHIEQGPVLFKEGISVGIVENIVGLSWIMATITGEENHAGTTPMKMRKDALVAASDIISFVNRRANRYLTFSKRLKNPDAAEAFRLFLEDLQSRENIADWQIQQAKEAIQLYSDHFHGGKMAGIDEADAKTPLAPFDKDLGRFPLRHRIRHLTPSCSCSGMF